MSIEPQELNQTSPSGLEQPEDLKNIVAMLRNRKFQVTGTPDDVIDQLQLLNQVDQIYTQKQKFWKKAGFWSLGLTILSLIILIATEGRALVLFVPMVVALVTCIWMYSSRSKLNVYDRRHRVPESLLRHLKVDMPPDATISLEIDFRHYHSRHLQTDSKSGGFFSSVKQKSYEVPWLAMKGQLYDGSKFRFKITQCVKRKEKNKRKSTKITETFRDKYNLVLAVKPHRYPVLAKFDQAIGAAQPPYRMGIPTAKVMENRVTVQGMTAARRKISSLLDSYDPERFENAHTALQLFLTCYHGLGKCRGL